MKRIYLLFLALCLCLTACGSTGSNVTSTPTLVIPEDAGAPIAEAKNCKAVLQVQVNPKFELYLNDEGKVIQVICLNDDAREAFANCEVIGQDSSDALQILLSAAQAQEYLTDSSTVSITPVAIAEDSPIQSTVDALPETIEYIRSKLNSAFSVLINHTNEDESENPNGYKLRTRKRGDILLLQYFRSDGTLAEEHALYEAVTCVTYFRPNETVYEVRYLYLDGRFEQNFYNVNGKFFAANYSSLGGTLAEFPVNGGTMVINDPMYYPDAANTLTFRADGTLASWRAERPSGTYREMKYDSKGVLVEEIDHMAGSATWKAEDIIMRFPTIITTYTNGVRSSSTGASPDGSSYSATYYPNGTPQYREVVLADGSIDREWYVEVSEDDDYYQNSITSGTRMSGLRSQSEHVDANGCLERTFYETDGIAQGNWRENFQYSADGTLVQSKACTRSADGNLLSSVIRDGDGTVVRSDVYTYSAEGNLLSLVIRDDVEGYTSEHVFGADGSERITWLYDGCYPRIVEFDAAGNSTVIEEGGQRELHTTDDNGNPLYIFWRKDGVQEQHTTLPGGTVVSEYFIEVEVPGPDGSIWYQKHRCDVNGNIID